jgi:hypothetical protein
MKGFQLVREREKESENYEVFILEAEKGKHS